MSRGERFSVRLIPEEGGSAERVMVEVGMEGFNVLSSDGSRVLRKYPLPHISRWSMRGSSLILFTRSPVDVEDRSVTLQGDEHTIRSVLDTLTCCCMQMAELLQSGQGDRAAANSLSALLKKSNKAVELPTADQVEFWKSAEKAGWMYSQGEHIKTWRKRWFILKQGFLFRFSSPDISPSSKPRGIVDLSQVTDVTDGSAATGRPNSIKISTATGSKCYLAESETAQVEWVSVLEGAVAKIVRIIAGVDEEADASPGVAASRALAEQFRTYSGKAVASAGGGGSTSHRDRDHQPRRSHSHRHERAGAGGSSRDQMVDIVNYGGGVDVASGNSKYGASASAPGPAAPSGDYGYINVDYGGVVGARMAPPEASGGSGGGGGMYGNIYSPPAHQQQPQQQQQYAKFPPQEMAHQQPVYGESWSSYGQPLPQQQQQQQQQFPSAMPAAAAPAAEYGVPDANGGGGGYQQEYAAYAQQAQQQQQVGGSTLMDAVTTPPVAAPPQQASPWQVHYTADGRPYYYNSTTQITQWEAPAA